jgi:hypothetical protein
MIDWTPYCGTVVVPNTAVNVCVSRPSGLVIASAISSGSQDGGTAAAR